MRRRRAARLGSRHLAPPSLPVRSRDSEQARELNLKETTPTTLNALYGSFRNQWFASFRSMNREEVEVEDEKGRIKLSMKALLDRPAQNGDQA